ncbi:DUF455 family protein [Paenibacillus sp. OV219]|uniref:DUF455 family protein n=1 Tax=Paenibacillus sp. OV219 TaxID=1884377 RepID=UPI0008D348B1|nr:DUF455 family protein [Paenibacillus sp. OV219]SEO32511.1 Uncharacterized conserved protein, contains ferritin-like DUF455 domain [Paenibacillus sp. OV219]
MSANHALFAGKHQHTRTVEEVSALLKRFYLVEKEIMRTLGGYLISVTNWELNKDLPHHLWQDSLRADALRTRIMELRYPRRDVDGNHDPQLSRLLSLLIRCLGDNELLAGVYDVVKQELMQQYQIYLQQADPLSDAPTIAFMWQFPEQIQCQIDHVSEIRDTLLPKEDVSEWRNAIRSYLQGIGGIVGNGVTGEESMAAEAADAWIIANRQPYKMPAKAARDPRFVPAPSSIPPKRAESPIEIQVLQAIYHLTEIWAAEAPGLAIWTWDDMPWEFYLDLSRWAYDESRHVKMGELRLIEWGFDIGMDVPVYEETYASQVTNGGNELDLMALLHRFEIDGPANREKAKQEFEQFGDLQTAHHIDYDWADEAIHLKYGHKWLMHRFNNDYEKMQEVMEKTLAWYNQYVEDINKVWDYEPFLSRIADKMKRIESDYNEQQ